MKKIHKGFVFILYYAALAIFSIRHFLLNKRKRIGLENKLIVVSMAMGEERYLKEFIEFYIHQGVDHFVIYDNSNDTNQKNALNDFIDSDLVTVFRCPRFGSLLNKLIVRDWKSQSRVRPQMQELAFAHFLHSYSNHPGWILQIDIDEFLYGKKKILRDLVSEFEAEGVKSVSIAEYEFGSSYLVDYPPSVVRYYKMRKLTPSSQKSLGKLSAISPCFNAHKFSARRSFFQAMLQGVRSSQKFRDSEFRDYIGQDKDPLRLNHYKFKCLRDIIKKRFSANYLTSNSQDLELLPVFFQANNEILCDAIDSRAQFSRNDLTRI